MAFPIILLLGAVLFLTGCGHSNDAAINPAPAATVPPTNAAIAMDHAKDPAASARLQWNLDTLVGDYERHGQHNPKWDTAARQALEATAHLRSLEDIDEELILSEIATNASIAVAAGCDDPIVKYLFTRYALLPKTPAAQDQVAAFRSIAEALSQSERPPIRKYYAALRASEAANIETVSSLPEVRKWRSEAKRFLLEVAKDKTTPAGEISDAWDALLQATASKKSEFDDAFLSFEPVIFKNWPEASSLLLLKGYFYIEYAWEARGNGLAQSVTGNGWSLFTERLDIAETALNKAWELNPHDARIARRMISVELGQGQGRKRMELWFQRAMQLNPNYYDACSAKLHYLKPQWHGSRDEMLEFAGECLNSPTWGGHVPLIVIDVHEFIAKSYNSKAARIEYFNHPEVWTDIKQAFDKFFRLNPQDTGWHHDYALYAYYAKQWADLNRELTLLGEVNYDYFGGQDAFNKIVQEAKDHSSTSH